MKAAKVESWTKRVCEDCDGKELNGEKQWQEHLKTRKHKNAVHRKRKEREGTLGVGVSKKEKVKVEKGEWEEPDYEVGGD